MRLADVARFVKSNNAGATYLTFDIGFHDTDAFDRAARQGVISAAALADIYRVPAEQVMIYPLRQALLIKITLPRPYPSGGADERDFDGVQQFAPLLDVEVPD